MRWEPLEGRSYGTGVSPVRDRGLSLPCGSHPSNGSPGLGIGARCGRLHTPGVAAAKLSVVAPAASPRLLADVSELHGRDPDDGMSARERLETALGPEFADRLVEALSAEALDRLESALSPAFAERLAAVLAKERGGGP